MCQKTEKIDGVSLFLFTFAYYLHGLMKKSYRELLTDSFKSNDTEEWLDVYFTRPIGLALALVAARIGATPNMITVLGILLGACGGWLFHYTDLWHNVCGVLLLMMANFCDSADGQLARLTQQKTLVGRILDGLASDVWFVFIYVSIVVRLWHEPMPFIGIEWGIWGFLLCSLAGFICHATQCNLADYYRQIHLWFVRGEADSELASSAKERALAQQLKAAGKVWEGLFHEVYGGYCRKQERQTPRFQAFFTMLLAHYPSSAMVPETLRTAFREGSLPLMKYTNILTHNTRAFVLFVSVLINIPYLYPLFEIGVLQPLYGYMRYRHEQLSEQLKQMMI